MRERFPALGSTAYEWNFLYERATLPKNTVRWFSVHGNALFSAMRVPVKSVLINRRFLDASTRWMRPLFVSLVSSPVFTLFGDAFPLFSRDTARDRSFPKMAFTFLAETRRFEFSLSGYRFHKNFDDFRMDLMANFHRKCVELLKKAWQVPKIVQNSLQLNEFGAKTRREFEIRSAGLYFTATRKNR